ncbi:MAG: helix-turn-helix transcriptional regulator [Clostridia bacterium]
MTKEELQLKLGANIVKYRLEKGLKQYELADKLEIEDSALRRIEKGRTNISVWLLQCISEKLEIQVSQLLKFD